MNHNRCHSGNYLSFHPTLFIVSAAGRPSAFSLADHEGNMLTSQKWYKKILVGKTSLISTPTSHRCLLIPFMSTEREFFFFFKDFVLPKARLRVYTIF